MTEQPRPSSLSPRTSFTNNGPDNEIIRNKEKEKEISPGLRHRGLWRAANFAAEDAPSHENPRRNSTLSDSVSEARNSIRSSTDDLLLPRVSGPNDADLHDESHWQSSPLGLALLPAIAGVFFQNGGAVVTDITLLILAAIFLNWSVRLPWDWYRSAQIVRQQGQDQDYANPLRSEEEDTAEKSSPDTEAKVDARRASVLTHAATKELQIHELAALASCFIFPMIGTWLLHTIRSKLSRPSEGLVSNYNLTIFLLASEIRPFAHLLRMVQARTLHLQRTVRSLSHDDPDDIDKIDAHKILDITKRLEELESHVAEAATARLSNESQPSPARNQSTTSPEQDDGPHSLVSQTITEVHQSFQPDIDALNRAVRRYEKRSALNAFETDSRLRSLETQVRDAVALAATAQRSSGSGGGAHLHRHFAAVFLIFESFYTILLIPVQIFLSLIMLPFRVVARCLEFFKGTFIGPSSPLSSTSPPQATSRAKGKMPQPDRRRISPSQRSSRKKSSQVGFVEPGGTTGTGTGTSLKTIQEY